MSAPKRFFVEKIQKEVALTGEEFRHASAVLRLQLGDEVTLLNGSGKEYTAVIAAVKKGEMLLNVTGERVSDKEPKADVYLLAGALKGDKTELVVQKAVELGVNKIGVFSSRYCAAYLSDNKLERLNKVAREAAKQCLRAVAPEVIYFADFPSAVSSAAAYKNKLFSCEFLPAGSGGIPEGDSYALIVGSEGGFTEEEYEFATSCGFCGVSLGKRILRAETAAIALLSVVMYRAGELK